MNYMLLVHFSVFVACLSQVAIPKAPVRNRTYVKRKPFKMSLDEVERLHDFRSELDQFLATYVKRDTIGSTIRGFLQRRTRGTYKIRLVTRPTKITTRITYKTKRSYPSRLERRKVLYKYFVSIFAGDDEEKTNFLTNTDVPANRATTCYMDSLSCFMTHCLYDHYYKFTGIRYIKDLLARACSADWLDTRKIVRVIEGSCQKRFKFKPFIVS